MFEILFSNFCSFLRKGTDKNRLKVLRCFQGHIRASYSSFFESDQSFVSRFPDFLRFPQGSGFPVFLRSHQGPGSRFFVIPKVPGPGFLIFIESHYGLEFRLFQGPSMIPLRSWVMVLKFSKVPLGSQFRFFQGLGSRFYSMPLYKDYRSTIFSVPGVGILTCQDTLSYSKNINDTIMLRSLGFTIHPEK